MSRHQNWSDFKKDILVDPEAAQHYLGVALEEFQATGERLFLLRALRSVAEAQGGVGKLAERVDVKRESLYRALSEAGNPTVETLCKILTGLHLRLRIEPISG